MNSKIIIISAFIEKNESFTLNALRVHLDKNFKYPVNERELARELKRFPLDREEKRTSLGRYTIYHRAEKIPLLVGARETNP